jgi:hypothetical protein
MSATQNGLDIRYLRPIKYPWAFGALHIVLDVITAKLKFRDKIPIATILFFPTMVCWSRSAFRALGNPTMHLTFVVACWAWHLQLDLC